MIKMKTVVRKIRVDDGVGDDDDEWENEEQEEDRVLPHLP